MIKRRHLTAAIAAGMALSAFGGGARAQLQPHAKVHNIVLVHGAYADGSCWSEVIGRLQTSGVRATAVQNPLTSLADDVAAARRILASQDGPSR